jgi:hypothetical protein
MPSQVASPVGQLETPQPEHPVSSQKNIRDGLYIGRIQRTIGSSDSCVIKRPVWTEVFVYENKGIFLRDSKSVNIITSSFNENTGELNLLGPGGLRASLVQSDNTISGLVSIGYGGGCVHPVKLNRLQDGPPSSPLVRNNKEDGIYESPVKPVCEPSEASQVGDYFLQVIDGVAGIRIRGRGVFGFIDSESNAILKGHNIKAILTKIPVGYEMSIDDAGRVAAPSAMAFPACHMDLVYRKRYAF